MSDRHVVVYIAADAQQAHMLRNLLAESGIDSFVSNETLNSVHFAAGDWMVRAAGGPGFLPMAPKVVVHQDDADQAREIVLAAEEQMLAGTPAPELIALEAESGEEQSWPLCPHCARPRLATCPVCKSSGVDFPAAFLPETSTNEEPPPMVLCPTCDEAFAPRYPARCEWCGHRFTDGYESPDVERVAAPISPAWTTLADQLNPRAVLLIAAMLALGSTLVGWFYYVLR